MSSTRHLTDVVHDAISDVTIAAEGIHKSIADFPLLVLEEILPLRDVLEDVREIQDQTIHGAYGLVRQVNDRVRQLATSLFEQPAA